MQIATRLLEHYAAKEPLANNDGGSFVETDFAGRQYRCLHRCTESTRRGPLGTLPPARGPAPLLPACERSWFFHHKPTMQA